MPTEVSAKALEQKLCVLTLVCTLDMPTEAGLLCSHRPLVQKEQFPPFLVHHFYCSGYRGSKNKTKTNNNETNQNEQKKLPKEPHSCYTVHSESCGHIVVLTMNKFIKNLNINTRMCKEHIPKSVLW